LILLNYQLRNFLSVIVDNNIILSTIHLYYSRLDKFDFRQIIFIVDIIILLSTIISYTVDNHTCLVEFIVKFWIGDNNLGFVDIQVSLSTIIVLLSTIISFCRNLGHLNSVDIFPILSMSLIFRSSCRQSSYIVDKPSWVVDILYVLSTSVFFISILSKFFVLIFKLSTNFFCCRQVPVYCRH